MKEIGLAIYCKSFSLKLNQIELIGISPRLALDDETIFILVIDSIGKIYPIPYRVIGTEGLDGFEEYFRLPPIQQEWKKFAYNDYYGKLDKVIYPKEKYGMGVFVNDWKLWLRSLYAWIIPKSFYGNLDRRNFE